MTAPTVDWRDLVTRAEDPEHLAGTEVDPPLGWGADYDEFVAALAKEASR